MAETTALFPTIHPPNEAWLARMEAEPVLEPDRSIIDAHLHLWDYNGHQYFLNEYNKDLLSSGHRVDASVFVECSTKYRDHGPEHLKSVGETEFAARMAVSGKHISSHVAQGIVAYADLTLSDKTHEAIEAHMKAAGGRLRGIRQRAKWDPDPAVRGKHCAPHAGLYLEPGFGMGMEVLARLGLTFDASVFHPQIPDVTALARAYPEVGIVLNHTGSPVGHSSYAGRGHEVHASWLASMKELASCPNVSVKLGGLLINLANFNYVSAARPPTSAELAELWRPYIEPCIELFGADRCMVSSNFPVDKAAFSYRTVWNMFKRIMSPCSADEKDQLFSGTARHVYRLA
jgi:L-fuconolactonase